MTTRPCHDGMVLTATPAQLGAAAQIASSASEFRNLGREAQEADAWDPRAAEERGGAQPSACVEALERTATLGCKPASRGAPHGWRMRSCANEAERDGHADLGESEAPCMGHCVMRGAPRRPVFERKACSGLWPCRAIGWRNCRSVLSCISGLALGPHSRRGTRRYATLPP